MHDFSMGDELHATGGDSLPRASDPRHFIATLDRVGAHPGIRSRLRPDGLPDAIAAFAEPLAAACRADP